MRKTFNAPRLVAATAVAAIAFAVAPMSVAAAPAPAYTASCALSGPTTASWRHVRIDYVDVTWRASDNTLLGANHFEIASRTPRGSISVATPSWTGPIYYSLFIHFTGGGTHDGISTGYLACA